MNPDDLLLLLSAHNWLGAAALVTLYVRFLLSDQSKFKITLPPQLLHLATAGLLMLSTFLGAEQAHAPLQAAIVAAVTTGIAGGFLDGLLTAIFGDNAPAWAKTLVMLVDDLTPKGGGKAAAVFALLLVALSQTACLSAGNIVPETPQNADQIHACQGIAAYHNGVTVGGIIIGGIGGGLAGTSAAMPADSQSALKTDLAVGAAVLAGGALITSGLASLSAAEFTDSHCADVVGTLPAATRKPKADADPPLERLPRRSLWTASTPVDSAQGVLDAARAP